LNVPTPQELPRKVATTPPIRSIVGCEFIQLLKIHFAEAALLHREPLPESLYFLDGRFVVHWGTIF
jgi:hypothetical protein